MLATIQYYVPNTGLRLKLMQVQCGIIIITFPSKTVRVIIFQFGQLGNFSIFNHYIMKNIFYLLVFVLFAGRLSAQQAISSCGASGSGPGGSMSFTIGQVDFTHVTGYWEGVQQPYSVNFVNGNLQSLTVCENTGAASLDALLEVYEPVVGQSLTWQTMLAPLHGTLVAAYTTTSTGLSMIPSGLTYTPYTGYNGADSFAVRVIGGQDTTHTKIVVTINPLPFAGVVHLADSLCAGANTTPIDSGANVPGYWASSNTAVAMPLGSLLHGVAMGTANIYYVCANSCGNDTATASIYVSPLPVAGSISGADSLCTGSTTTLADGAAGGLWVATSGLATVSDGVVTALADGADTIKYMVTNGCGTANASKTIYILSAPGAITLTGPDSLCPMGGGMIVPNILGGSWTAANANATIVAGAITAVTAGIDTINYTISNICGSGSGYKVITVNPLPVAATIGAPDSLCAGATATITVSATGGTWTLANTNASLTGGVVTAVATGIDTLVYAITNSCGTASASAVIQIVALPDAGTITGSGTVCAGASLTLTNTATGGSWSMVNGKANILGGVVTGVAAGTDTAVYTVTNTCGTDFTTKSLVINSLPVVSSINGLNEFCVGSVGTFTDSTAGGAWYSTSPAMATISSTGGMANILATGMDTIIYVVNNSCGADTASITLSIMAAPLAGSISGVDTICLGSVATLTDTVAGGQWMVTDTGLFHNTPGTSAMTALQAGTTTVGYTVTNTCGTSTATINLTAIAPPPVSGIVGADSVCRGAAIVLTDTTAGGLWSMSNANASITAGTLSALAVGYDTVLYTVANRCGSNAAKLIVRIDSVPDVTLSGGVFVCLGSRHNTDTLTGTPAGGAWSALNTYAWVNDSGIVRGDSVGLDTIYYTVRTACGMYKAQTPLSVYSKKECTDSEAIATIPASPLAINIYPNPNSGNFIVELPAGINLTGSSVVLTDLLGNTIQTQVLDDRSSRFVAISRTDLAAAAYFVTVRIGEHVWHEKVVVW